MLSTAAMIKVNVACLSAVFFDLFTCCHIQFLKIFHLPSFFSPEILILSQCIYNRQNLSFDEIPSSQNSDKAASLILANIASSA